MQPSLNIKSILIIIIQQINQLHRISSLLSSFKTIQALAFNLNLNLNKYNPTNGLLEFPIIKKQIYKPQCIQNLTNAQPITHLEHTNELM